MFAEIYKNNFFESISIYQRINSLKENKQKKKIKLKIEKCHHASAQKTENVTTFRSNETTL